MRPATGEKCRRRLPNWRWAKRVQRQSAIYSRVEDQRSVKAVNAGAGWSFAGHVVDGSFPARDIEATVPSVDRAVAGFRQHDSRKLT
jgi:hypothetical protein